MNIIHLFIFIRVDVVRYIGYKNRTICILLRKKKILTLSEVLSMEKILRLFKL